MSLFSIRYSPAPHFLFLQILNINFTFYYHLQQQSGILALL
ncbi:hypothetical protein SIN_04598 [Salmonella enterica subsp. enterica serovar Infantis]|nr:hypothetical protein SIN_04598 [Salmonella enterica subsp. enterica serovar Infantis]